MHHWSKIIWSLYHVVWHIWKHKHSSHSKCPLNLEALLLLLLSSSSSLLFYFFTWTAFSCNFTYLLMAAIHSFDESFTYVLFEQPILCIYCYDDNLRTTFWSIFSLNFFCYPSIIHKSLITIILWWRENKQISWELQVSICVRMRALFVFYFILLIYIWTNKYDAFNHVIPELLYWWFTFLEVATSFFFLNEGCHIWDIHQKGSGM